MRRRVVTLASGRRGLTVALLALGAASCTEKADPPVPKAASAASAPSTPPSALSASNPKPTTEPSTPMTSLYDLSVSTLEGDPQPLSVYKGKVALVVNVASECGFTPQYQGLEKLYEAYKDKGFVLLGFPSNDFGGQEPGDGKQIRAFCSSKFHVTFPMFEKVKTKGDGRSPVYAFLAAKDGEPKWNFHKYLVAKDGHVLAAFPSKVEPESKELKAAIDAALAK
jgi:glutathione peroxidase